MSEIDVSKCDYYFQGRCGVSKNINYSIGCHTNDCYYKQLQQLKQENEGLKKYIDRAGIVGIIKILKCLDEIEEIVKDSLDSCYTCNSSNSCMNCDKGNILEKIKQAKEGGE